MNKTYALAITAASTAAMSSPGRPDDLRRKACGHHLDAPRGDREL